MTSGRPEKDFLRDAIERNATAVLSLPSAGMLRHHKSRLLADAGDGFWVESVPTERPLLDELVTTGTPVGVSFKSGVRKVVLASPIRLRQAEHWLNPTTCVEAILLAYPDQVKAIQRRSAYRVRVLPESSTSVRIWRMPDRARLVDRPMAAQAVVAELRDVSLGGLGVTFHGNDGLPPKVSADDRLRVELTYKDAPLLLEARMCHRDSSPEELSWRAGLQFKAMEGDIEGRQKLAQLTRIIGELQRDEARRGAGK